MTVEEPSVGVDFERAEDAANEGNQTRSAACRAFSGEGSGTTASAAQPLRHAECRDAPERAS